jgi:hypothetical protein
MLSKTAIALSVATACALPTAGTLLDGNRGASASPAETVSTADVRRAESRAPSAPLPFARTSFWNAPLSDKAALDGRSDAYVRRLNERL